MRWREKVESLASRDTNTRRRTTMRSQQRREAAASLMDEKIIQNAFLDCGKTGDIYGMQTSGLKSSSSRNAAHGKRSQLKAKSTVGGPNSIIDRRSNKKEKLIKLRFVNSSLFRARALDRLRALTTQSHASQRKQPYLSNSENVRLLCDVTSSPHHCFAQIKCHAIKFRSACSI